MIAAAINLFSRGGYAGTSTRDIAKDADITPSLLFYYFPTKAELYVATVEAQVERIGARLDEALSARSSALDGLDAFVRIYIDCFLDEVPGLLVVNREFFVLPLEVETILGKLYHRVVLRRLEGLLDLGIREGVFQENVDVVACTIAIDGLLKTFLRRDRGGERFSRRRIAAQVLEYYLPSLLVETAAGRRTLTSAR